MCINKYKSTSYSTIKVNFYAAFSRLKEIFFYFSFFINLFKKIAENQRNNFMLQQKKGKIFYYKLY